MVGPPIVVGYDGSAASDAAARWAAGTAERLGRRVRMIHVMPWPVIRSTSGASLLAGREVLERAAERLLEKACRRLRSGYPEVAIEAEVTIGDLVPSLLRAGAGAAMLVLGSRGLGEVRELTEGSVTTHVATHATGPVVVVPAGWSPRPGDVVVGVDGSAHGRNAIGFAFRFAEEAGESVRAVLAWHDPQSTGPGDMRFPVTDPDALEEDSAAVLGEAVAGQAVDHPDVKTTEKLVHGIAATVLVDESRDASLLVVGSHGRGRLRGLLLGSVSRAVLHHAACPIAVVR
nr:universal stress protein [Kribbella solani]